MKEAFKFGIVGFINTLIHASTALYVNQSFGFNTIFSNITGFGLAVTFPFSKLFNVSYCYCFI